MPGKAARASGWVAATATLFACGGCGFKGPLYLPQRNATVVTHPTPAAQGAAKQKDKSSPASPASAAPSASPPPPI